MTRRRIEVQSGRGRPHGRGRNREADDLAAVRRTEQQHRDALRRRFRERTDQQPTPTEGD